MVRTASYTYCVPSGLNFEAAGGAAGGLFVYLLLFVQLFASRASSRCKNNMGTCS